MLVVVCGGAGYIGSHVVGQLIRERFCNIKIIDNLSTGHIEAIERLKAYYEQLNEADGNKLSLTFDFYNADVRDSNVVIPLLHGADCVIHLCAFSLVGESMTNIPKYYDNNVYGAAKLLEAIKEAGVPGIVFSSTAACYGEPAAEDIPLKETARCEPVNVYGETKLCMERMIKWQTKDMSSKVPLSAVALRYFNVCGAGIADCDIGEDHNPETHLIPNIVKMLQQRKPVRVFGNDYETRDGTCVRDYIDVEDLARAHVLAVQSLYKAKEERQFNIYNVGTKTGSTVLEIIEGFHKIVGHKIDILIEGRRAGDPATLIADASLSKERLRWEAKVKLEDSLRNAYKWHINNPEGYATKK